MTEISSAIKPRKVSIQGYEGCFHQVAARNYFGNDVEVMPCATFREVTEAIENGTVDAGVMAIENSIAGSILPNYSLLQNCSLRITGEVMLHISQNLMALPGIQLDDITEVRSHPMALLQCADFLSTLSKKPRLIESVDTALSAKELSDDGSRTSAAIAGPLAAELFGLDIIAADIHTVKNNYTRFLIIERGDKAMPVLDSNKASLYFKLSHKHGSLISALRCFELYDINMTKLQSYPIPADTFRYLFHVDVEFNSYDNFCASMEELRKATQDFCICGIYQKGETVK